MTPTQDQTTGWPPTTAENTTECRERDAGSSHVFHTALPQLSVYETQETASYNYSDASSIGRFPSFNFSLHSLMSLSTIYALSKCGKCPHITAILVAILEVEGPDTITIKHG